MQNWRYHKRDRPPPPAKDPGSPAILHPTPLSLPLKRPPSWPKRPSPIPSLVSLPGLQVTPTATVQECHRKNTSHRRHMAMTTQPKTPTHPNVPEKPFQSSYYLSSSSSSDSPRQHGPYIRMVVAQIKFAKLPSSRIDKESRRLISSLI